VNKQQLKLFVGQLLIIKIKTLFNPASVSGTQDDLLSADHKS